MYVKAREELTYPAKISWMSRKYIIWLKEMFVIGYIKLRFFSLLFQHKECEQLLPKICSIWDWTSFSAENKVYDV